MIELKRHHNGFTLVELVITIAILAMVAAGCATLVAKGMDAFFAGRDALDAEWQGRIALERMTREIRNIRSDADISTATSNTISFIDNAGNQISYYTSGSQLLRQSPFAGTAQVLADGIVLTFAYYDGSGAVATIANNIRYIVINVNVTYGGANFNLTTGVYPWNFH
jgi:prepilin-type N-terminal cleavage/methylation domain-containing protein